MKFSFVSIGCLYFLLALIFIGVFGFNRLLDPRALPRLSPSVSGSVSSSISSNIFDPPSTEQIASRETRQLDIAFATACISAAFLVLAWFRRKRNLMLAFVAVMAMGFAIFEVIELWPFERPWLNPIYVLVILVSIIGMVEELCGDLGPVYKICRRVILGKTETRDFYFEKVTRLLVIGIAVALFLLEKADLKSALICSRLFGFITLFLGLATFAVRLLAAEDADANELGLVSSEWILGGIALLLYSQAFVGFLRGIVAALSVFISLIYLIGRVARENNTLSDVLPSSVLEIARMGALSGLSPDRTASEINWIVFNDLTGSTVRRLTHLAVAMQIFQSALHKIMQSYFKDAIHYASSSGDALLLALKSPAECRNGDPILEKLVRTYACHLDGVKELEGSFNTILSVLELENEELSLAMAAHRKFCEINGIEQSEMHFRTILTMDHYYYGFNHALPCIDSQSIYISMKSEKLILDGKDGGFIIFSNLMDLLRVCLPEVEDFFNRGVIDKTKCSDELKALLPDFAFVLDPIRRDEFHHYLEKLYGGPLYLKRSTDGRKEYGTIRPEVDQICQRLSNEVNSLAAFDSVWRWLPKSYECFSEKNIVVQTLSNIAVKYKIWDDPVRYLKVRNTVLQIGVPGAALLDKVSQRDLDMQPNSLLGKISSNNTIDRNAGIRFLSLARVQSKIRPHGMKREDFGLKVLESYFSRYIRFSVESHIYLIFYFLRSPEYSAVMREYFKNDSKGHVAAWKIYLRASKAPALNGLLAYVTRTQEQWDQESEGRSEISS